MSCFNIEKHEKEGNLFYVILFEDKRPEGIIAISKQKVEYRFDSKNFKKLGLNDDDKIAFVDRFFPLGYLSEPELKGYNQNGTGTEVLTELIKDLSQLGFKAIDVISSGGYKKEILRKNNFLTYGEHNYRKI